MPTPFYHLDIAHSLLTHPRLSSQAEELLKEQLPAFLFGCTAPDVQTVSRQKRIVTHFYRLPYSPHAPLPWVLFFEQHPKLKNLNHLPASHAAFLVGYLIHLQADFLWTLDVFVPNFECPANTWASPQQRQHYHNVLRSYVDLEIRARLEPDVGTALAEVHPETWLPFVDDDALKAWRDVLVEQFQPGATSKTVEIFAQRHGTDPEEFFKLIHSPQAMEEQIFRYFPVQRLEAYRNLLILANLRLMAQVL